MILFPPAKINLGLNIKKRRTDGYHEIESVMVTVPIYDALEILPADSFSFKQSGTMVGGDVEDNLVVKAYRLIKSQYSIPEVYIHLRKQIPTGAGLGGGSSDAAYTLIGLNSLFNLEISIDRLKEFSSELGSDCAFFIEGSNQLATGRGELVEPIDLSIAGYYLRLINPGIHVNTAEAYSNVEFNTTGEGICDRINRPISTWKKELKNDFEPSVFRMHPQLLELKERLYLDGAIYASMTGSGSSLFGIYSEEPTRKLTDKFERIVRI